MRLLGICDESEIMKKKSRRLRLFFGITFILQRETASGRKMEANSCWSSTPPRESLGCGVVARGNKHHVRSLLASLPGKSGACGATTGTPITPWALLVMFGGVRETLLPSAPSQGTNLGADMQGARGKYTTNTVHCIDYKIQMHNRFTTTYEYATNTVQYTHTRRGARGKGADCSWGEV